MNAVIEARAVRKIFPTPRGPHVVLNDVSFTVGEGEAVCLLGPSGGGKSTLLRTLNGLETIQGGTIRVCGRDLADASVPPHALRRPTAMIFQRFELFPHLTAVDNVSLAPREVLGLPARQARELAENWLERVGLKDHGHKYPRALSGGQQQRVAIARALALDPKVLLCDEPTSALDPELVGEVLTILAGIAGQGITLLVVTHEMGFAREIADRCLFLDGGEIREEAPAAEFFQHPKSDRLRQFLERIRH